MLQIFLNVNSKGISIRTLKWCVLLIMVRGYKTTRGQFLRSKDQNVILYVCLEYSITWITLDSPLTYLLNAAVSLLTNPLRSSLLLEAAAQSLTGASTRKLWKKNRNRHLLYFGNLFKNFFKCVVFGLRSIGHDSFATCFDK